MKILFREGIGRLLARGATISAAVVMLVSLSACADQYATYPNRGYYANRYVNSNGPYYGPYANRPIGYGPPLYSVYPYNNYNYRPYPSYGYGNGVNVSGGGGYGGPYYRNGYGYRGEKTGKKRRKKLRQQALRDGEVAPVTQPGVDQR